MIKKLNFQQGLNNTVYSMLSSLGANEVFKIH